MPSTPVGVRLVGGYYAPRIRRERLIATARVALAAFSLLIVWLGPPLPALLHPRATNVALVTYVAYALMVAMVVWLAPVPLAWLSVVTHVLDLLVFSMITSVTDGPTSPFFICFVFLTIAATLRWQWRGAMWTAIAALVVVNGIGVYGAHVIRDPAFELSRFVIRSVYLAATAALLGYVGAYEERRRRELSELGAWPQALPRGPDLPLREMLRSAARILRAPRVLLVWEDADEPWLNLASWARGEMRSWREAPETFDPPVAEPVASLTFLSPDVRAPLPVVLHRSPPPDGLREWRGAAIHDVLRQRFAMTAVLSLPLHGQCLSGHLFALDNPRMTADDLLLGEVLAHQVTAAMDQSLLSRRLQLAAAAEERVRLSRDLHDGVLQSLTGAALQLETVHRLWDSAPRDARERLAAIQRLIADEQRDLRYFIRDFKIASTGSPSGEADLDACLREVVRRVEVMWDVRVSLRVECEDPRPSEALVSDIGRVVHEAVVNAARHAAASEVGVTVVAMDGQVRIAVTDNGHGFPFKGEYDHTELTSRQLGPVMLKERVESLKGTLAIRSTTTGSRLDIRLPCFRRTA